MLIRLQWNEGKFPLSEFIKAVEYCSRTPLRMGIRGLQKRKEPYERLHKMVG